MTRPGLNPIGATAAAAELAKKKHREWLWCRRKNGFSDLPLWREVAELLGLPLYQVQAFGGRLEELANHAGNIGHSRGYVGHFRASEFAAAMGMPAEDTARIYAALEQPEIGWIVEGHVADFYDRNRDGDDVDDKTQAERARRSRAFRTAIKEIERQRRAAIITTEQFASRVLEIATMKELAREGLLPEADLRRRLFELQYGAALSTAAPRHSASHRDAVTVTTEQSTPQHNISSAAVDNSGAASRGNEAGLAEQSAGPDDAQIAEAELWLNAEAIEIVVVRLDVPRPRAETLIARWRRDLDDDPVATAEIISGCDKAKLSDSHFLGTVTDHIRRIAVAKMNGGSLALMPVRAGGTDPPSQRHAVTAPPVDKPAAPDANPAARRSGTDG